MLQRADLNPSAGRYSRWTKSYGRFTRSGQRSRRSWQRREEPLADLVTHPRIKWEAISSLGISCNQQLIEWHWNVRKIHLCHTSLPPLIALCASRRASNNHPILPFPRRCLGSVLGTCRVHLKLSRAYPPFIQTDEQIRRSV